MLFSDLIFFYFFAVVFVVYWALPYNRARKLWLLAASYFFYGAWDWRFCSLIALSTLIDFAAGWKIGSARSPRARRVCLIVSLCANLGLLGFFKYFNFFLGSLTDLLGLFHIGYSLPALRIVLPVGISFFTFQSMSYTIDIYRGQLKPRTGVWGLLDFALFVSFFPQLVAGPIVRAVQFLPLLDTRRHLPRLMFRSGAQVFLLGFIKKVIIADNVSMAVDSVFADPGGFGAASQILGVLLYGVQIYCDFCGYSDMAIGTARMLGYELVINFDAPYSARSVTDFWRRWHMSLSTWLRDYLYIPLGGNRISKRRTDANLMTTMLLGGLWHGAGINFVVWGGLHGGFLLIHKHWTRLWKRIGGAPTLVGAIVAHAATLYFVNLAWIFFRARSFEDSLTLLKAFTLFQSDGLRTVSPLWLCVLGLLAAEHVAARFKHKFLWIDSIPDWLFAIGLGATAGALLPFLPVARAPFIYFQF